MCELDYRFDSSKTEAIFNGFVIVPAKLIAIVQQPEKGHWKEKFSLLANIKVALRIVGTLPVTSCECERSFSALRRLKTYTRSTMVAERLNGLALLHVHKDIIVNMDKVIDLYAMKN